MRAFRLGALVLVLLAACTARDDDPEVRGVAIERETSTTTTPLSRTASRPTTTTTAAPSTTTTTDPPTTSTTRRTPTTDAPRSRTTGPRTTTPPPPPPTTTTEPPQVGPPAPGSVEGDLVVPDGTRARLLLVDDNTGAVVGGDSMTGSGSFSFGAVEPGDYRVETSTEAPDGAVSETRGTQFTVGTASTVRLRCDPGCSPA